MLQRYPEDTICSHWWLSEVLLSILPTKSVASYETSALLHDPAPLCTICTVQGSPLSPANYVSRVPLVQIPSTIGLLKAGSGDNRRCEGEG